MTIDVNVTASAFQRIAKLSASGKGAFLRISVDGGGCKGFAYKYEFVNEYNEDDLLITDKTASIVIDKVSLPFVHGATINYVQELGAAYFEVQNPNAKSKCGCGSSFTI